MWLLPRDDLPDHQPVEEHAHDRQMLFHGRPGTAIGFERLEMAPGITPDRFAREMINAYVAKECKGKLRRIERSYVEREMERRADNKSAEQNINSSPRTASRGI
jgi:hypothetical protein